MRRCGLHSCPTSRPGRRRRSRACLTGAGSPALLRRGVRRRVGCSRPAATRAFWASLISTMRAGKENTSAISEARKRLAPATISKPSEFGRTVMGWMSPLVRMDSASSCSLASSKVRRGLVADSWMVSMAMYWNSLLFCTLLLLDVLGPEGRKGCGAKPCLALRSVGERRLVKRLAAVVRSCAWARKPCGLAGFGPTPWRSSRAAGVARVL